MDSDRQRMAAQILRRYRSGQMPRRDALRLLGGFGLTTVGGGAIGLEAINTRASGARSTIGVEDYGGHGGLHGALLRQDAGTPVPMATPQIGERPDGTRVWRVVVGAASEDLTLEASAFGPEEITINAGDAIFFDMGERFHTVTFLSGAEPPPLVVPEMAAGTPAASPAAGPPRLLLSPEVLFPSGGNTYDGTGVVNSGVPGFGEPTPFVLTFIQPGTYEYLCLVHPMVMKATVIVQEPGAAYPQEQDAYDQMAEELLTGILDEARALADQYSAATPVAGTNGTGVWEVTAGVAEGQAEAHLFVPEMLSIKAGDTVRWVNRTEDVPHTVTFISGGELPELILVEPSEAGPPTFVLNPEIVAPAGGSTYSGQGFVNSGFLGEAFGGPQSYELTIDAPGEHVYFCAIHGTPEEGMRGTLTVE